MVAEVLKYVKIPLEKFQKLPDGKAHEPLYGLGWKFFGQKDRFIARRERWRPFQCVFRQLRELKFGYRVLQSFFILWKYSLVEQQDLLRIYPRAKKVYSLIDLQARKFNFLLMRKVLYMRFFYFFANYTQFFPLSTLVISWFHFYTIEFYLLLKNTFFIHSSFLVSSRSQVIRYSSFKITIPFGLFLSGGLYLEYFRFFKYTEYLKRVRHVSHRIKARIRRALHVRRRFRLRNKKIWINRPRAWWWYFRWLNFPYSKNVDSFPNSERVDEREDNIGSTRIYSVLFDSDYRIKNVDRLLVEGNFRRFFFHGWFDLADWKYQQLNFHLYYFFFHLYFIVFIHRCTFVFRDYFTDEELRYRRVYHVGMWWKQLKLYNYEYTKWVYLYAQTMYWRLENLLKFRYYFELQGFEFKLFTIFNFKYMNFLCGSRVFKILSPVLNKMGEDIYMGMKFLRSIAKAFKKDLYFNIVSLYSYYNEPTFSFLRWLNYFHFSMDLLIWRVYSSTRTTLLALSKHRNLEALYIKRDFVFEKTYITNQLWSVAHMNVEQRKLHFIWTCLPAFGSQFQLGHVVNFSSISILLSKRVFFTLYYNLFLREIKFVYYWFSFFFRRFPDLARPYCFWYAEFHDMVRWMFCMLLIFLWINLNNFAVFLQRETLDFLGFSQLKYYLFYH